MTTVTVEVDLDQFETDELLSELNMRTDVPVAYSSTALTLINTIHEKRRLGRTDYQVDLDDLIHLVTGKIS